jgi:hypothetical protein
MVRKFQTPPQSGQTGQSSQSPQPTVRLSLPVPSKPETVSGLCSCSPHGGPKGA